MTIIKSSYPRFACDTDGAESFSFQRKFGFSLAFVSSLKHYDESLLKRSFNSDNDNKTRKIRKQKFLTLAGWREVDVGM